MGSTQGSPGHAYAPWLAVQDAAAPAEGATPTYGIALEWSGNWQITADAEPGGSRTGPRRPGAARGRRPPRPRRHPHHAPAGLRLQRGRPRRAGPCVAPLRASADRRPSEPAPQGALQLLGGDRLRRRRRRRSWNSPRLAADLGAELFVVDDGWFTGRHDDTGGLGDWDPDPAEFPGGFDRVRRRGPRARHGLRPVGRARGASAPRPSCTPSTPSGSTGSTAAPPRSSATSCCSTSAARTCRTSSSPPSTGCSATTTSAT